MYADELKVFKLISGNENIDTAANSIDNWCITNKMFLNISKCNIITFTRKRIPIKHAYTEGIKNLGIWLDEKLLFKKHIDVVAAKSYSTLSLIK